MRTGIWTVISTLLQWQRSLNERMSGKSKEREGETFCRKGQEFVERVTVVLVGFGYIEEYYGRVPNRLAGAKITKRTGKRPQECEGVPSGAVVDEGRKQEIEETRNSGGHGTSP